MDDTGYVAAFLRNAALWCAASAVAAGALGLPSVAAAQVSDRAAAEAREQGFDAREALGSDVTLDGSGAGQGLFRVELDSGASVTTHGPDSRAEVADHGTSIGPGDPERPPACASTENQHVLYGAPADGSSRYPDAVPEIRAIMRRINAVLNEESVESGGPPTDYRVLCEATGEIKVDTFTGPAAGADSFREIVSAAQAAGFNRAATKYTIFYETPADGYCGVGSLYEDDRLSADNDNNVSRSYGVTHDGCWNGDTPIHENGHNMGAVQPSAPKSTGSGAHCFQEHDVMCYSPDGGDRNQEGTVLDCSDRKHFDCGNDDYFDTAPEAGEYLASHWNLGSPLNRFLAFGAPSANAPPVADFDFACTGLACSFTDASTDSDGTVATRAWSFGDGAASAAVNPAYAFPGSGTYNVSLTVTDTRGATSTTTQAVQVTRPNRAPVATNDAATLEKNVARELFVLANDRDLDGDALRLTAVSDPARGSATVSSGGQRVRYAPDPGYIGSDSLTYTVSDGRGGQATATVALVIRDTIAPRVASVAPGPSARNVSPATNVRATFSEPIRARTVNPTTVKLVRRGTTTPVRAAVRYTGSSRTVTLDPSRSLRRGATYTARVSGARDMAWNTLSPAKTWSFTVRR